MKFLVARKFYTRKADMWKDKVPEPAFRSFFFFRHLYFVCRTDEKLFHTVFELSSLFRSFKQFIHK